MKNWKPFFIENSRVPAWLSKILPFTISALSFGPFVWSRKTLTERLRTHETIHFQQQLELGFVLHWVLYGLFMVYGWVKYRSFTESYYNNPFEKEAFDKEKESNFLDTRPRYHWVRYLSYK